MRHTGEPMAPGTPDSKAKAGGLVLQSTEPLRGRTGILTEPNGREDRYRGGRAGLPAPERQNPAPQMAKEGSVGPLQRAPRKGNVGLQTPALPLPAAALLQLTKKWCLLEGLPGQGHEVWGNFCSVVSTVRWGCFPPIPPTTH